MKKILLIMTILCMILSGCGNLQINAAKSDTNSAQNEAVKANPLSSAASKSESKNSAISEPSVTIYPLPDSTMGSLDNATIAISLEKGNAYVDDSGVMRMDVKVYSYDLFDMVDISKLKVGDIIVTHSDEVKVSALERNEFGTVLVNGGLENGGFDLFSDGGGVYYEIGFSDVKNWHEVGKASFRVSTELEFSDNIDPDKGEQIYYAGSFLADEITDYNFTPHNTTVRTENGQIVSMKRIYTP